MQAAIRRSLWSASKTPSRFVAGRRHPLRTLRNLHISPVPALSFPSPIPSAHETPDRNNSTAKFEHDEHNRIPGFPASADRSLEIAAEEQDAEIVVENEHENGNGDGSGNGNGNGNGDRDRMSYGSGLRRAMRNKKPKDIPPWDIPSWFLRRNVRLYNYDPPLARGGLVYADTKEPDAEVGPHNHDKEKHVEATQPSAEETMQNITPDAAREYVEKLGEYLSVVRKHFNSTGDINAEQRDTSERVQKLVTEMRERLRVARRDGHADTLLEAAEKQFSDVEAEISKSKCADYLTSSKDSHSGVPLAQEHEKPFQISSTFMNEVLTLCAASFATLQSPKSHLKLLCPIDGAIYLVDRIVDEIATQLQADIVRLDAQDFAQILGDYVSEGPESAPDGLWTLGYDTGPFSSRSNDKAVEEDEDLEEDEAEDEAEEFGGGRSSPFGKFPSVKAFPMISIGPGGSLGDLFKKISSQSGGFPPGVQNLKSPARGNGVDIQTFAPARNGGQEWNDMKMSALLDFVLDINNVKDRNDMLAANMLATRLYKKLERAATASNANTDTVAGEQISSATTSKEVIPQKSLVPSVGAGVASNMSRKTIVYIRGYKELRETQKGNQILNKIVDLVRKKRKDSQEIMIIGASCSVELAPRLSGDAIEALQAEATESAFRHLVVAPKVPESDGERQRFESQLDDHAEHYLFSMNARHLHNMILRMQSHQHDVYGRDWAVFAEQLYEKSSERFKNELKERLWSVDEVHRTIFTAIGTRSRSGRWSSRAPGLDAMEIGSAGTLVLESDSAKHDWAEEEQLHRDSYSKPRPSTKKDEAKAMPVPKKLSKREQRLMRGVVNAEKIHTTFNHVHAPKDTIEALKTLTTLSLKRPDAFKYGVLATDKISGVLLYGPPGTGKTLLAKAVAKDTGATMLEVSGSDLYDMYVGEGEKNVAAVFSLAKKLAPCVVFIDEADAIFASRGSGGERKSHREMINQFLKEWDGMNETTAFIMVATNRPFDLDEAALRRLPRRILVDLPSEKDREAILGIHLKDEAVDPSVTISALASQTPLYSGSDLKNIAVAAALAAVREENDDAAKYTGEGSYKYPEKRVLAQRHFDKAMEEISASISEDMDSLGAIKKFDEKYGDRRGRRKKTTYGFTGVEVETDTAKVRK